jgi:hypothetical protein
MEKSGYQKRPESPFPVYFFFLCDSSVTLGNTLEKSGISPIEKINHIVPSVIKKIGELLKGQSKFKGFIRVLTSSENPEWQNLDNIRPDLYVWKELHADGPSNLGAAFIRLAKALRLREDRGLMRKDGPIPVLILILGSVPDDDWESGLEQLDAQFWGEQAVRFSVTFDSYDHDVIPHFLEVNNSSSHSLSIDQMDELPSQILAVLEQTYSGLAD